MKKFTKILSLVLAVSLIASFFTVNVMAANTQHTVALSVTKADGTAAEALVKDDTVVVTVAIDSTALLNVVEYKLVFDSDVFIADETLGWESEEDFESHPNYIDQAWFDGMFSTVFGKTAGTNTTINKSSEDTIYCSFAGGTKSVPASKNENDFVIGKFNFKVKDGAANGTYEFALSSETNAEGVPACNTMDSGENSVIAILSTPATVTVGTPAPAEKADPTVVATPKEVAGENDLVTLGYHVAVTASAETKAFNGITITASANEKSENAAFTFPIMNNGTVKVAVNVVNVPSDKTVDFSYAVSTVAE